MSLVCVQYRHCSHARKESRRFLCRFREIISQSKFPNAQHVNFSFVPCSSILSPGTRKAEAIFCLSNIKYRFSFFLRTTVELRTRSPRIYDVFTIKPNSSRGEDTTCLPWFSTCRKQAIHSQFRANTLKIQL